MDGGFFPLMALLIFYLIILPILAIWFFKTLFTRYAKLTPPKDILALYRSNPIEKGFFRVVRRENKSNASLLGDFDKHDDAVDAAYQARSAAQTDDPGKTIAFFVLDDQGQYLEEVDA